MSPLSLPAPRRLFVPRARRVACTFLRTAALACATALAVAPVHAQTAAAPVRIGTGIDAAYTPWYLANSQKGFDKAGLKVNFKKFANGGEALDGSLAGMIDMSGAAEPSVLVRMAHGDVRALAVFGQSANFIKLAVRPGITDARQIKKYGVIAGSVSDYATVKLLEKNGIDPTSVQIIKSGPPELPALLTSGAIDAFFSPEPWPSLAVKQGAKILMNSGDVGYTFTLWVTAAGPWFDTHQDDARRVVASLAQACREIRADPTRGAAAAQAETKAPPAMTLSFLSEVDCTVRDFTDQDMASYDQIADFLAKAKITPTRVDFRKSMVRGFYKE